MGERSSGLRNMLRPYAKRIERGDAGGVYRALRGLAWEVSVLVRHRREAPKAAQVAGPINLNFGCGEFVKADWVNVDMHPAADFHLDLRRPFPFADQCAAIVYSEHFFEHLDDDCARQFVRESFRVLLPNGIISVVVPDARRAIEEYVAGGGPMLTQLQPAHVNADTMFDQLNALFRQGDQHRWLYDPETLLRRLTEAGFRDAHVRRFDPKLDEEHRAFESLYVEARK